MTTRQPQPLFTDPRYGGLARQPSQGPEVTAPSVYTGPGADTINLMLSSYTWLNQLGEDFFSQLIDLVIEFGDQPELIVAQIRQTEPYKARFAGLAIRQGKGLPAISEAQYLQLEQTFAAELREYNLLDFYAPGGDITSEQFRNMAAGLIGKDVSGVEFSARLDQGFAQVRDADPLVLDAFEDFYGVTPTDEAMLLYFLDTDRGLSEIERQVAAATVGAEAYRYGLNITRTRADLIARQGYSQQFVQQGFSDVARETPQLQKLARIHSFTPLSQEEIEDVFFHEDPEVLARRRQIFGTALADFQSGGRASTTRTGGLSELFDLRRRT